MQYLAKLPYNESVQGAPLLPQVIVVAVQHKAVTIPPGNNDIDISQRTQRVPLKSGPRLLVFM